MTRTMSPMHLGRPSSHMPHSFVRPMIFMEHSGYEVWRTVGWPQDPQVLNEVWLRSVQNISRRYSDLPKISNKLTMSKTAQAGNWCLDLYHRLSVPRGECSTEGFACWELWEFVITCTTRLEASASVRTLLWHVCLTHLSTCLSTRLCRLVIWKHKTQPDGQHEVMAKSQKLSNLSKQSRTVAQSASEYLMKPWGSFRLTAAPRDFQGASGTVNQF